ncbi:tyrosine-trna ligase [Pyrrhoderma noxium]|uniref:Tyrosine--tRNA ligase n=1 Tax=Pyrrhoderma noxium TaxID=2282107 RepID=A0A286UHA9_9AGAM|nr:tyrosine-trna ligase [Pyrrhoderma noxium]
MLKLRRVPRTGAFRTVKNAKQCRNFHFETKLLDDLNSRGMISQKTEIKELEKPTAVYLGIDPSAKSLHVGHLLPLMVLLHFHLRGHSVIPLIGGATGLVGDPSGKLEERTPLGEQKAVSNVESLSTAVTRFFETGTKYAAERIQPSGKELDIPKVANNVEWLGSLSLMEFLTKVGRYARVPAMISRDSVKIRMESKQGISFTEFTYQLLQAYDFYHLYHSRGCTIQLGGQDQWGNIVSGIDLVDRTRGKDSPEVHGITTPLLTTASGAKFGKSEGNAVWLDKQLTSVLDFYQFFLRTADHDVEKYLKIFTLKSPSEINEIVKEHNQAPERRKGQRLLADEVVQLVHGKEAVRRGQIATRVLFETSFSDLSAKDIVDALEGDPRLVRCSREDIIEQPIWKLAANFGLVKSNSEARRLADSKGLYLNNTVIDSKQQLQTSDLVDNGVIVLRAGKEKHLILAI